MLVTGGGGFIGSHLVDRLVDEGWFVHVLDNFSSGRIDNIKHHLNNSRVKIINSDLKDLHETYDIVKNFQTVFHYAPNQRCVLVQQT